MQELIDNVQWLCYTYNMRNRAYYINQLVKYMGTPVVKVITGIRRSGKSSLLQLWHDFLLGQGVQQDQIIHLDFDSIQNESYQNYKELYNLIYQRHQSKPQKLYLLIDEIQEVEGWERVIRSCMVDFDCDMYITGSNARLLSGELATYIAGRYVEIPIYPLSFQEHLDFYMVDGQTPKDLESVFYEYLQYGGFPGLALMSKDDTLKRQYIRGIYDSVVLKDVIRRNNIRDPELLERIFIYIMDNVGHTFSAKKIANYLKSQGRKTGVESVYSYIRALESALILYTAKRYDVQGKKILERMEKYFLADLGLRYSMLGYQGEAVSQLLENVVFLELKRRGFTVYVGKEGDREIDFIAEKQGEKLYIQVTFMLTTEEVIMREFSPLLAVQDNFKKFVVSMDSHPFGNKDGIQWMHMVDFLLADSW